MAEEEAFRPRRHRSQTEEGETLNVVVLTRSSEATASQRLAEAGRARGHTVALVDPLSVFITVSPLGPQASPFDAGGAVIPAFGPDRLQAGLAAMRFAECQGFRCLNGVDAFERANDKVASVQELAAAGVPMPPTVVLSDPARARWAMETVGGAPLVIKTPDSWRGQGVVLAESSESALSILDALADAFRPVVVQRHLAAASRAGLQTLVIDGEVRAAMRSGAPAESVVPSAAQAELAARTASVLGLRVAGIDILSTPDGDLLSEVHAVPEVTALEEVTGIDVAGLILQSATDPAP